MQSLMKGILTPNMRLKLFQNDIGWYLEENVRYKEDGQSNVVLLRTRGNVQVFSEAEDDGICNIRPAIWYFLAMLFPRHL